MPIIKDLQELLIASVIDKDTADKIEAYYAAKYKSEPSKLVLIFGVLGALLIGLGIILILAHNWDEFPRIMKTVLAFIPLFIGQIFCAYTLWKRRQNKVWLESTSTFLFFAVGASISLISQIYNLGGELSSFLLTWMLLCLPLVYIMKSSVVSILYILGITYYACELGFWTYPTHYPNLFWLLVLGILFHYYELIKNNKNSNIVIYHSWMLPISIAIVLGTYAKSELSYVGFFSLFGFYFAMGNTDFFRNQAMRFNSFRFLGAIGTIVLLFILSFDWMWSHILHEKINIRALFMQSEFLLGVILTLMTIAVLAYNHKTQGWKNFEILSIVFLLFRTIFILGHYSTLAQILINLIILAIGVMSIRKGVIQGTLGRLNFGLLTISVLICCRFFDTDLSFIWRGVIFMLLGMGFFGVNYWMIKMRK